MTKSTTSDAMSRYRKLEHELRCLRDTTGEKDPEGADAILDEMESLWDVLSDSERAELNSNPSATWPKDRCQCFPGHYYNNGTCRTCGLKSPDWKPGAGPRCQCSPGEFDGFANCKICGLKHQDWKPLSETARRPMTDDANPEDTTEPSRSDLMDQFEKLTEKDIADLVADGDDLAPAVLVAGSIDEFTDLVRSLLNKSTTTAKEPLGLVTAYAEGVANIIAALPRADPDTPGRMAFGGEPLGDRDLVQRAVMSAAGRPGRSPRWSHVAAIFSVGSTTASALCVRFEMDPDEVVGLRDE